jgi:hypothetical protein
VAETRRRAWIASPGYDQWFLLGGWLVALAAALIALTSPMTGLLVFVAFQLVDDAHIMSTWPVLFGDRGLRRLFPRSALIFVAVIVVSLLVTALGRSAQIAWWSLFLYLGTYHIIRQHYGFLRLYQSRARVSAAVAKAETDLLQWGCATALFLNYSEGWVFEPLGDQVWALRPPAALWWLSAALTARALIRLLAMGRAGAPKPGVRYLLIALALSNFWLALVWLSPTNILVAIILVTLFHDLQYLALVWLLGRRRYAPEGQVEAPFLAPLFRRRGVFLFLAFAALAGLLQGIATGLYAETEALGFTARLFTDEPQLMTYVANLVLGTEVAHFLLDGRIWRFGADDRLRREFFS